jgi:hypothetical protein
MSDRPPMRCLLTAAVLAVALAGCGSSSKSSTTPTTAATTPAASATTSSAAKTTTAAPPNGVASKSGPEILAASVAALGQVHSFHFAGHTASPGQHATLAGDVQLPGRISVTISTGPATAHVVSIDNKTYFNANAAYFAGQKTSAAVIAKVANRWVYFPTGQGPTLGSLLAETNPATLGECLIAAHVGTVTRKGLGTVNGQPAVILADKGDKPGSTPGLLWVATTGPPLPLRTVQTGAQKPGGTPNQRCLETSADVSGGNSAATATLTNYNAVAPITPPAGAVSITSIAG